MKNEEKPPSTEGTENSSSTDNHDGTSSTMDAEDTSLTLNDEKTSPDEKAEGALSTADANPVASMGNAENATSVKKKQDTPSKENDGEITSENTLSAGTDHRPSARKSRASLFLTGLKQWLSSVPDSLKRFWKKNHGTDHPIFTLEPPKGIPRAAERVTGCRTIIIDFVLIGLVLLLVWAVWGELNKDIVLIEPFTLTPEIKEKGYTPEIISNMLVNQINIITKKANTSMQGREYSSNFSETLPDIEVPEAHVSLKSIIRYIKGFFNSHSIRINGEASLRENNLQLAIRTIKESGDVAKSNIRVISDKPENINSVLLQAAKAILKEIEPYILASYLYSNGDNDASLVLIEYCLYHDPPEDDCWAYNLWGIILYDQEDNDGAIAKYDEAIKHSPNGKFPLAYSNWALVSMRKQDYKDAEQKCEKALKLDPKSSLSHNIYALLMWKLGKFEAAEAQFREAIKCDPDSADAYNNWGKMLRGKDDYLGAKTKFQLATEVDPEYSDAYNNLGDALERLGDLEGAGTMYKNSRDFDSKSPIACINLGDVLLKQQKYPDAIVNYEEAINRTTKYVKQATARDMDLAAAYIGWGNALAGNNDYIGAIDKYNEAIQHDADGELGNKARDLINELQKLRRPGRTTK